ncbi:MAG: DUF4404 family protein [Caldimonas sp.]
MTNTRHLDDALSDLRSEIRNLDLSDEDARRRLDLLVADIGAHAGKPEVAVTDETLVERLKSSTLEFELSHPRLAVLMNDLLEKLSTMGV